MLLVDSHCHLDRLSYGRKQTNMADVLAKAAEQDVGYFLCVSVTQVQFPTMLEAIAPYPQVFASCGVHPLNQEPGVDAALLLTQAADERVVAIGETGLDYFYSPENKEVQQASFREHIRVARALNKPLIIHTRDAQQDTLQIMREEGPSRSAGCCTASPSRSRWPRRPWRWVLYLHLRHRHFQECGSSAGGGQGAAAGAAAG